jgi:hypothetical protein
MPTEMLSRASRLVYRRSRRPCSPPTLLRARPTASASDRSAADPAASLMPRSQASGPVRRQENKALNLERMPSRRRSTKEGLVNRSPHQGRRGAAIVGDCVAG